MPIHNYLYVIIMIVGMSGYTYSAIIIIVFAALSCVLLLIGCISATVHYVIHAYRYWCGCCHKKAEQLYDINFHEATVICNPQTNSQQTVITIKDRPPEYSAIAKSSPFAGLNSQPGYQTKDMDKHNQVLLFYNNKDSIYETRQCNYHCNTPQHGCIEAPDNQQCYSHYRHSEAPISHKRGEIRTQRQFACNGNLIMCNYPCSTGGHHQKRNTNYTCSNIVKSTSTPSLRTQYN